MKLGVKMFSHAWKKKTCFSTTIWQFIHISWYFQSQLVSKLSLHPTTKSANRLNVLDCSGQDSPWRWSCGWSVWAACRWCPEAGKPSASTRSFWRSGATSFRARWRIRETWNRSGSGWRRRPASRLPLPTNLSWLRTTKMKRDSKIHEKKLKIKK